MPDRRRQPRGRVLASVGPSRDFVPKHAHLTAAACRELRTLPCPVPPGVRTWARQQSAGRTAPFCLANAALAGTRKSRQSRRVHRGFLMLARALTFVVLIPALLCGGSAQCADPVKIRL